MRSNRGGRGAVRVKDKSPAPVQLSASRLVREAAPRSLDLLDYAAPQPAAVAPRSLDLLEDAASQPAAVASPPLPPARRRPGARTRQTARMSSQASDVRAEHLHGVFETPV